MLKPSGTNEWKRIGGTSDFNVYLPKPQAFRTEDQAEALEPVQLDFSYKKSHSEEDDDVDMIPLIDVSLVLLIFFMLISAGAVAASPIKLPGAHNPDVSTINPKEITIGIDLEGGTPVFSLGIGNKGPADDEHRGIHDLEQLKLKISEMLGGTGATEVTINAHRDVRSGLVRDITAMLGSGPFRSRVTKVLIGVNETRS
jgi:biopolymer transport protein ExbD